MPRIDIARLRKDRGMSQGELAQHLQITQSFLSAIENGKSPLPPEKEMRIMEIFNLPDLDRYIIDQMPPENDSPARTIEEMNESDLFNQLLNRFHDHAHRKDASTEHHTHHDRIAVLEERIDKLLERNDRLLERNDTLARENDRLREETDSLRKEIFSLKETLLKKQPQ